VNDRGFRIGEKHHNSTIPDAVVVQMRDLYEHEDVTPTEIARRLGCKLDTVKAVVYYKRRAQVPADWREVDG
jgi:transcription initiation factor IIE alpha subunit